MKKQKDWYITFKEEGITYMQCKKCSSNYVSVSDDVVSVTCSTCVTLTLLNSFPYSLPKTYTHKPTGRPAGWHWMNEFVDKDGNVFHKGVEQPDLKGTLEPTKVKPSKKRKKVNKDDKLLKRAKAYKEKQKLKRDYQKQKDFLNGKVKL